MSIRDAIARVGTRAADRITKLAVLSPEQLREMEECRENYLSQIPNVDDDIAEELTRRLLAASSVEVYNEYLRHIQEIYAPIQKDTEFDAPFRPAHNIRFYNITKWVTDRKENSLEKLVNVYEVLSNDECNIALVFHRSCKTTDVYLAVTNIKNADNNNDINSYSKRLIEAVKGNFPGAEWKDGAGIGIIPCLNNDIPYSVACASNIPGEKSEKFISQTIEKLLDGIVPDSPEKEYTIVLLATPLQDIENRKLHLAELYSALAPYAGWQTNYTYTETEGTSAMATFGLNAGVSAGIQSGRNASITNSNGVTDSTGSSVTDSTGSTETDSTGKTLTESTGSSTTDTSGSATSSTTSNTVTNGTQHSEGSFSSQAENQGKADSFGGNAGFNLGVQGGANYNHTISSGTAVTNGASASDAVTDSISNGITSGTTQSASQSIASSVGQAVASQTGRAVAQTVGQAVANTLGKAVTKSVATASGIYRGTSFGGNFGANFARSSNITTAVGKNEGITQSFTNFNIKHTLEILEEQMKRLEQSAALGMWDFAAYVMSEDQNVANNVAHSYLALTQGEHSYISRAVVNLWRGDMGAQSDNAKEICAYLRELRHPLFGLNPAVVVPDSDYNVYPPVVNAATSLSGKELAYSLNFPQKSVTGLPVIECAEFARNIVSYEADENDELFPLGKVFHMNRTESTDVALSRNSLASHTFVTGSTGSGKSNTVYEIISQAASNGVRFLVVEPAKGEYKNVFGDDDGVHVYGTNPSITPLLRIDPFSFPSGIHVLEHLDRLVEIFNVCWPMYAAMPAVLKSAVEKSYEDCGWDLIKSENKYGEHLYPDFSDVARNVKMIIDRSEYDKDNKGAYKGSLLTRLTSLTTGINGMIFSSDEIPYADLFDCNVIVDLSRVGSSETKSLIMGMLVLKLQEYRMDTATEMNAVLKHITVLEEAHNLLRRTSVEQATESANILGKSVEMLANAIAEMRTYGEGFIIADQAPGLMDMSVIRNTNTKIIMRLPDQGDRELVGKAANLNDDQIVELAKLPRGVAAVYQNEWIQPVLCKVAKYDKKPVAYAMEADANAITLANMEKTTRSLLACIMDKELMHKGDKEDLRELKSLVIRSKLDTAVKVDLIEYIRNGGDKAVDSLRRLVYDFLEAKSAIEEAKGNFNVDEWVSTVVNKLNPSIKGYTSKQIDIAVAMILYEQMIRDSEYTDLFIRFTEIYKRKGGVF